MKKGVITFDMETKYVEAKIRSEYTDGKFILLKDYDKYIRRKKINEINANNE
jgi:hypothetical protein